MPSVNSRFMPNVWPSSTLTTPSLPTFSIASAITSPISSSPAEIVATRAICSLPEISTDCVSMFLTTSSTARSMPRLSASGLAPAATFFRPWRTIAWASTVAVVVPSPATSLVAVATSRTSWAPWFWKTSSTSISRAMVTPSLVIVGAPNFLSRTTYRPLGPSVTLTALATASTPNSSALRASASYLSSLCAISVLVLLGLDLGEDVGLTEDEELLAVHLDLRAAVLAVEDLIALDHVERRPLSGVLVDLAVAYGKNLALLGLLLGGIRQDDATGGGLLLLDRPHDQSIA